MKINKFLLCTFLLGLIFPLHHANASTGVVAQYYPIDRPPPIDEEIRNNPIPDDLQELNEKYYQEIIGIIEKVTDDIIEKTRNGTKLTEGEKEILEPIQKKLRDCILEYLGVNSHGTGGNLYGFTTYKSFLVYIQALMKNTLMMWNAPEVVAILNNNGLSRQNKEAEIIRLLGVAPHVVI